MTDIYFAGVSPSCQDPKSQNLAAGIHDDRDGLHPNRFVPIRPAGLAGVCIVWGSARRRKSSKLNSTFTGIEGLEVGHYTDLANATGCTVVLCRKGATGGVDVRGGSPGTRETDLLRPGKQVDQLHAILLSGAAPLAWMRRRE